MHYYLLHPVSNGSTVHHQQSYVQISGDRASPYAQQGTDAHELCEYKVLSALGHAGHDPTENLEFYDAEMENCTEEYRNFVMEQYEEAKTLCADPLVLVDQRLDFSN